MMRLGPLQKKKGGQKSLSPFIKNKKIKITQAQREIVSTSNQKKGGHTMKLSLALDFPASQLNLY